MLPPSHPELRPRDPHEIMNTDSNELCCLRAASALQQNLRQLHGGVRARVKTINGEPVSKSAEFWWPKHDPCAGMLQTAYDAARPQRALQLPEQRPQLREQRPQLREQRPQLREQRRQREEAKRCE